jgi:hypothetical protein
MEELKKIFLFLSLCFLAVPGSFISPGRVSADSVSMTVIAPGPVTDLTRVEAKVSIRNPGSSSQSYNLELYRESSLGTSTIATTNVVVPAGGQSLYSEWISTAGHAGNNTIKYRVTPAGGSALTGESAFQVVASRTRAVPLISTVWLDPGAVLPGLYFQTRPVTAQDVRNSIDAAHAVGVETLVITYSEYILNNWGSFYPSEHYNSVASFDVVGTILNQASRNGQKVFVGLGRGDDLYLTWNGFNDPNRIAAALEHGTELATELWNLYSQEPSFYGWYLSHEANDIQRASDSYYNPMTDILKGFQADKPVMVSPSGTPIVSPAILENSKVDIFAYQDAVGAGYIPSQYTYDPQQRINMLDQVYQSYQAAHAGVDKHLWTNLESWQMNGPTYSNPYPADFSRLMQQIEIEKNYVDVITSYEWMGFFEQPETTIFWGGQKAINLYTDYRNYYQQIAPNLKIVNYVNNPGFEQGAIEEGGLPLGWQFTGNGTDQVVSLFSEGASGSETSVSLTVNSAEGLPWLIQDIPVVAGAEYKFSAFVKELISDPSGGWLAAQVWMLADGDAPNILDSTSLFFSESDWELKSSFITAPAGATIARLVFAIQDSAFGVGTGHYLIDGVSLVGPEFPKLPGDFNGDFVVDMKDLAYWQAHYGSGENPLNGLDFLVWQRNVGRTLGPLSALAAVPEPAGLLSTLIGLAGTLVIRFPVPQRQTTELLVG